MEKTRATLLSKIRNPDAAKAWEEFYRLYGSLILHYAINCGLDEHLAQDVLQETMMALMRLMPDFQYDPSRGLFRNLLLTIVHRRINRIQRQAQWQKDLSLESTSGLLEQVREMADPAATPPDRMIDKVWRQSVEQEAWRRAAQEFESRPATLAIYDAFVREGRTARDVASEFGLSLSAVSQVKIRVERVTAREIARILKGLGEQVDPAWIKQPERKRGRKTVKPT